MSDDPRVAFLRELERADEEVATTLTELDELAADVERIRNRTVELQRFHVLLPAERERRSRATGDAERAANAARETLRQAEKELAAARAAQDDNRLALARRFELRARDGFAVAERRADEARAEHDRLDEEVAAAEHEAVELERRAGEIAEALHTRPRLGEHAGSPPPAGLEGTAEFASRARAALFVARGALASERDALVRQANELGSLVLGEPLMSGSAATVARRVEHVLGGE